MTQPRDPDLIIATWLEDGPVDLPDETRRAIAVGLRTQPRARRLAFFGGSTPAALVAAAVIVLVMGGLSIVALSNRAGDVGSAAKPSLTPSPSPSAAASPDDRSAVPAMTRTFVSKKHGYAIRYPVGWTVSVAAIAGPWSPVAHPQPADDQYDYIDGRGSTFRAASALIPDGVVVDDWIGRYLTDSNVAACEPPRESLEPVTVDGHRGRLRGFCGDATEIEVTVIVGNRVYLFTLFRWDRPASEAEERALFDALLATITLNPDDAEVAPSPSPS